MGWEIRKFYISFILRKKHLTCEYKSKKLREIHITGRYIPNIYMCNDLGNFIVVFIMTLILRLFDFKYKSSKKSILFFNDILKPLGYYGKMTDVS